MVEKIAGIASYASIYSVLIPAIFAIILIKRLDKVQRLIAILVLITFIGEFGNYALTFFEIRNLPAFHLFTVLQFGAIVLIQSKGIQRFFSQKQLIGVIVFFVLFAIVDAAILNGIYSFNSYSRPLASFIVLFFALCYFYITISELTIKRLENEPLFWLNLGVFIYFSGSLFIFLFSNYYKSSNQALFTLWGIHAIFNIFLNISYTIALWIRTAR